MEYWLLVLIIAIPFKILFWIFICYRCHNRREVIIRRDISIQSDQMQGQPGHLVQLPSGQLVRVSGALQPTTHYPGQAGTPGRAVDHDPRVGISPKVGLV